MKKITASSWLYIQQYVNAELRTIKNIIIPLHIREQFINSFVSDVLFRINDVRSIECGSNKRIHM